MAVVLGGANIVKMPVDKLFHGASIQPRQNLLVICGLSCLSIRLPRRDLVRKRLLGATSGLYTARGSGTRWGLGLDVRLHVRALRAMHGPVKTFSDLAACDMGSGAAERSGGVLVPTGTQREVRLEMAYWTLAKYAQWGCGTGLDIAVNGLVTSLGTS